jgi:Ca2+-binding RTX toxin-like protein
LSALKELRAVRLAVVLAGTALLVVGASAVAATVTGTRGPDVLRGGDDDDLIRGFAGNDRLYGGDDDDRIYGGRGNDLLKGGDDDDRLYGQRGNDRLRAVDDERELVNCGSGRDRAVADREDRVRRCENVTRRGGRDDDGRGDD